MDTWIQEFKTRSSLPNMDTQTQFSNIKTSEWILRASLILEFGVKTVHQQLSGVVEEFFLKGSFSFVSFLYYFYLMCLTLSLFVQLRRLTQVQLRNFYPLYFQIYNWFCPMHPINWFLTHDMQGFFFELRSIFPSLKGAKKNTCYEQNVH